MEFTISGLELPVRILPARPMTDTELMRFSEENQGLPIERDAEGYLVIMSPSGYESSARNVEINLEFALWNRHTGSGFVTESNGGYTLPDSSVRAPDAAWTSKMRIEALTVDERSRFAPLCPDFLIELRSPSDSLPQLHSKMDMWMKNGAGLAWLIDPMERTVTIYRQGREPERLDNISQVAGEGPVAGFVLPLDRIFT